MRLNILGCVPTLLNVLMELAEDSHGITQFNILQNTPVELSSDFIPQTDWQVSVYPIEDLPVEADSQGIYALSVVGMQSKKLVYQDFQARIGIPQTQFIQLIHPSAQISRSAQLQSGLQIEPLVTISACAELGFGIHIKRNCSIGHHCRIGDFVTIHPGVTISSFVRIGSQTMIGSGASIKDNITIGENCMIGMGSVVLKDIPPHSIAYGNPCQVHKSNR